MKNIQSRGGKRKMMFRKTSCWKYSCFTTNKANFDEPLSSIFSQYKNTLSTLSKGKVL